MLHIPAYISSTAEFWLVQRWWIFFFYLSCSGKLDLTALLTFVMWIVLKYTFYYQNIAEFRIRKVTDFYMSISICHNSLSSLWIFILLNNMLENESLLRAYPSFARWLACWVVVRASDEILGLPNQTRRFWLILHNYVIKHNSAGDIVLNHRLAILTQV